VPSRPRPGGDAAGAGTGNQVSGGDGPALRIDGERDFSFSGEAGEGERDHEVTEHLARATAPPISFEIIPPLRGGNIQSLLALIEDLVKFRPPLHRHHQPRRRGGLRGDGGRASSAASKRKRPGTMGVCALIQNKWSVDAVPHVLCQGFTREETEDFLIELRYLGIDKRAGGAAATRAATRSRCATARPPTTTHRPGAPGRRHDRGRTSPPTCLDASPTRLLRRRGRPIRRNTSRRQPGDRHPARQGEDRGRRRLHRDPDVLDNARYFSYVEKCRAAASRCRSSPASRS